MTPSTPTPTFALRVLRALLELAAVSAFFLTVLVLASAFASPT